MVWYNNKVAFQNGKIEQHWNFPMLMLINPIKPKIQSKGAKP